MNRGVLGRDVVSERELLLVTSGPNNRLLENAHLNARGELNHGLFVPDMGNGYEQAAAQHDASTNLKT